MEATGQDDISGRRLPFSRAFAQAGFNRSDAQVWRLAGWDDSELAAAWRHLERWCEPDQLLALVRDGFEVDQVEEVVTGSPGLSTAQIRARTGRPENRTDDEIDLRERVLENLHLGRSPRQGISRA